jgi:hypothetical protein
MNGLIYPEFRMQLKECGIALFHWQNGVPRPTSVVIRGLDGDYGVAAVHREPGPNGDVLIFDLGHAIKETP